MKYLSGIIFLLFALIICQSNVMAEESLKIGVLNLQQCIQTSNEGKRISEKLKNTLENLQKNLKEKEQELIDLQKDIEKQSLMLSMDAKESRQKEFEKKKRDLTYLVQDMQEDFKKAQNDENIAILQILQSVVETVAKKNKLGFIAERASVLYATPDLDITDQVIEELNRVKP